MTLQAQKSDSKSKKDLVGVKTERERDPQHEHAVPPAAQCVATRPAHSTRKPTTSTTAAAAPTPTYSSPLSTSLSSPPLLGSDNDTPTPAEPKRLALKPAPAAEPALAAPSSSSSKRSTPLGDHKPSHQSRSRRRREEPPGLFSSTSDEEPLVAGKENEHVVAPASHKPGATGSGSSLAAPSSSSASGPTSSSTTTTTTSAALVPSAPLDDGRGLGSLFYQLQDMTQQNARLREDVVRLRDDGARLRADGFRLRQELAAAAEREIGYVRREYELVERVELLEAALASGGRGGGAIQGEQGGSGAGGPAGGEGPSAAAQRTSGAAGSSQEEPSSMDVEATQSGSSDTSGGDATETDGASAFLALWPDEPDRR